MIDKTNWLALTVEEALEPELAICDPHHHVWEYPNSRYLLDELLLDLRSGHNIVRTVFVECLQKYRDYGPEIFRPVGETEFVDKLSNENTEAVQIAQGIVAFADLRLGTEVVPVIEAHLEASRRVSGFRYSSARDKDERIHDSHTNPVEGLLGDAQFRKGLSCVDKAGLTFDAWVYFHQIPELVELAKSFPNLCIILNHIGGPLGIGPYAGKREEVFDTWKNNIAELSKCENVMVKLGGLTLTMMGFGWHKRDVPPGSIELAETMAPYYKTCIDYFGAERCMFESNFPVDKASCSYAVLWNAFKRLSKDYSESERTALFHDTATRVYKLGLNEKQ
ncbi:MAG: amidohydrolase family protein [Gammaproteobacteria bacterium]|jgi:L-fuconolactonase|nr:amidohydrolase family protein [Gammaproteobacteria bacterium]